MGVDREALETNEALKDRYGRFAEVGGHRETCGGQAEAAEPTCGYAVGEGLYSETDLAAVPEGALDLSRGCGNPTGFAELRPGEAVVDFGCGGGIDVVLAAQKVGSAGRVIGIDFAPQMIERAGENVAKAGVADSVELRLEDMTNTQLPDASADVVVSNCVITLCPDKPATYREAFRLLRSGGRVAISDIVFTEQIPSELQQRFRSTAAGCLAGWAMPEHDYLDLVGRAGFTDIQVVSCQRLGSQEVEAMARCPGPEFSPPVDPGDLLAVQDKMASIKFTARKP